MPVLLDHTCPTPAENLALDEALLDACESGARGEVLRFWESAQTFVVVGYGNRVEREVQVEECRRLNIPILRRCSGGGAVVQGPGCLNYALILSLKNRPALVNITRANDTIMKIHRDVFRSWVGPQAQVRGHTDLAVGALKFSGNSQRRRRNTVLFHGTFLLNFDLRWIEALLRSPSRQPEYRKNRAHLDFVRNVGLSAQKVKSALAEAWSAADARPALSNLEMAELAQGYAPRYASQEWNLKF